MKPFHTAVWNLEKIFLIPYDRVEDFSESLLQIPYDRKGDFSESFFLIPYDRTEEFSLWNLRKLFKI